MRERLFLFDLLFYAQDVKRKKNRIGDEGKLSSIDSFNESSYDIHEQRTYGFPTDTMKLFRLNSLKEKRRKNSHRTLRIGQSI
jgi:hypothetical protein